MFQIKCPVDWHHGKSGRLGFFYLNRDIVAGIRDCRVMAIPDVLWDTATHCNTLQLTATHCSALQHTVSHSSVLRPVHHTNVVTACHCSTLQHIKYTPTHCNTLQHTATHCNVHTVATACHRSTLQHTATHTPTWQHVTVAHCNTLQHADHSDGIFDVMLCAKMAIIHWSWFSI